jgi:hypothetical protein
MSHRAIREGARAMAIWPLESRVSGCPFVAPALLPYESRMPDVSPRWRYVAQEEAMFGFGTTFCVLGDHRVSKGDAVPVLGRKDIGVCGACRSRWEAAGSVCARCKTPVLESHDIGLFVDRYALGHRHCGATLVGEVYVGV